MLPIPEEALALIRHFEAFEPEPYLCPAGYWTVGYGHAIRRGEDFKGGVSRDVAEMILADDAQVAARAVERMIAPPLNEGQRGALISFAFNLGAGALQRSTLRRKVNRRDVGDVEREFLRWVWAGGRKLPGLIRRRRAEAALFSRPSPRVIPGSPWPGPSPA